MDAETVVNEPPKERITVETMVKNQQAAFNERTMVTLHLLERLTKLEERLGLIEGNKRRRVD
jgi:hypothetical protein